MVASRGPAVEQKVSAGLARSSDAATEEAECRLGERYGSGPGRDARAEAWTSAA